MKIAVQQEQLNSSLLELFIAELTIRLIFVLYVFRIAALMFSYFHFEVKMARVTVEDCLDNVDNRFELVMLATKRARQPTGW